MRRWIHAFASGKPALQMSVGAAVIGVAFILAALGARLGPYDPLRYNPRAVLQGPSLAHLLGTDPLGRDVFSQIIGGARISVVVGILSVLAGSGVGTAIGLAAGILRGRASDLLMRAMDAMLVFPSLVLALAITAFLGVSLWNVIGALAVTFIPTFAILVRGEVLSLREREFVAGARALGARTGRIMWRHLLPNLSDVLFVQASIAAMMLAASGWPPPGTGQYRSPLVAKKRAPARMASNATCNFE